MLPNKWKTTKHSFDVDTLKFTDQAIMERTLTEHLFGHQYAIEMLLSAGQRSTAWVNKLPGIVATLNKEVTRLTGKKPSAAIKDKVVSAKPSTACSRPAGSNEKSSPPTSMCAISSSLASLKVRHKGLQTRSGL